MATRSEQFRAKTQRDAAAARTEASAETRPHAEHGHVEKKATYAHEEGVALEHRSRRSSRKSANHAKTDTTMIHAEQMKQGTPQQTYERTEARASRVRGGGTR
jgi:hypothetical protein